MLWAAIGAGAGAGVLLLSVLIVVSHIERRTTRIETDVQWIKNALVDAGLISPNTVQR